MEENPRRHCVFTSISCLDVVAEDSSLFFPTSPILTNRAHYPDVQRPLHPWEEASGKTSASHLDGVGCLSKRLTQLQTQVMSPFESSESDRVFNYLKDSTSIFRAAGSDSEIFFGRMVSDYTQVKLEDASRLLKIPNQNVQMFGNVFHDTNGKNGGET